MVTITYLDPGRGAWSSIGGTLSLDGTKPGPFYRAPAKGSLLKLPGTTGYRAVKYNTAVPLNDFAVYCSVLAIQRLVKVTEDGLFGPNTGKAVSVWQAAHKIVADGIVGSVTCETAYRPMVLAYAKILHPNDMAHLGLLSCGHIGWESGGWDIGAVSEDTHDLGLGQINAFAHENMNEFARFNPESSIPFVVVFVAGNIKAFPNNEDAQIAAYNLGRSGATDWVKAGMPDVFGKTKVREYINHVHDNMV